MPNKRNPDKLKSAAGLVSLIERIANLRKIK